MYLRSVGHGAVRKTRLLLHAGLDKVKGEGEGGSEETRNELGGDAGRGATHVGFQRLKSLVIGGKHTNVQGHGTSDDRQVSGEEAGNTFSLGDATV